MGMLFTVVFFPLLGAAVGRCVGRMQPFLAGAGIAGSVLFLTSLAHVPLPFTAGAMVVLSLVVVWRKRKPIATPIRYPRLPTMIAAGFAIWLLAFTAIVPLDDYDGRAVWLFKAKAIAHEGGVDGPLFRLQTGVSPRNQYPLLLPIDAALTMMAGRELDDRHARWLYACLAIGFALEVRRRFASLFSPEVGAWLAAALICLPAILSPAIGAASAGCDVALGAFAACAFFELIEGESPLRFGVWLSFMTLTKREGLPLAALLLAIGVVAFGQRIAVALMPLAAALAGLFYWRSYVKPTDEPAFGGLILDLPRHGRRFAEFLVAFAREPLRFSMWGMLWLAVFVAIVVLLLRRRWKPVVVTLAIILPMIALYAAVVAVTNWEPDVMYGLAPRLLIHLLGPGLYALAAALHVTAAR